MNDYLADSVRIPPERRRSGTIARLGQDSFTSSPGLFLITLFLFFSLVSSAIAQDAPDAAVVVGLFPQGFDQTVYKGVIGNVLDAIPMNPAKRLDLQRTNAVVGNTMLGRSLTVLVGLSNPILLVGGLVWGIWAASNIKLAQTVAKLEAVEAQDRSKLRGQDHMFRSREPSSAAENTPEDSMREPIVSASLASAVLDLTTLSPVRVVKVWLPQRSSTALR